MSAEQIRKRLLNQYQVLRTVHFRGPVGRSVLSRQCKIRKNSITSIVAELIKREILVEDVPGNLRSQLTLDTKKYHVLTASIRPQSVLFNRVYLDGRLEQRDVVEYPANAMPETVLDIIASHFQKDIRGKEDRVMGLGIAVRGIVDPALGVGLNAVNLTGWKDVKVGEYFEKRLDRPVHLDNDTRCQVRAHAWFEKLWTEHSTISFLALTEGIGLATICHGEPLLGSDLIAGEIGHLQAGDEGRKCHCGRLDCLEAYYGLPALTQTLKKAAPDVKDWSRPADWAGHFAAHLALHDALMKATKHLARVLSVTWMTLDPDILVIGGSDPKVSELILNCALPLLKDAGCMQITDKHLRIGMSEDEGQPRGIAARVIDAVFTTGKFTLAEQPKVSEVKQGTAGSK